MSNWAGFSEEDLKKIQSTDGDTSKEGTKRPMQPGKRGIPPNSKLRPQRAVQPMKKQQSAGGISDTVSLAEVPAAARLSQSSKLTEGSQHESSSGETVSSPTSASSPETVPAAPPTPAPTTPAPTTSALTTPALTSSDLLTDDDGRTRDLSKLDQYQQQQKMMEELNKKKKQMLAETLALRQKQAKVEANKLNAIKKELSLLDQMLTADVNVIRDKIEDSTREYAEASKRYELAEKEFVESKINLHRKSEVKEQLTQHLYTIIHQNEIRKANKLAELMDKLNIATEESDPGIKLLDLPSYSLLGNVQTVGSGNLVKRSSGEHCQPAKPQTVSTAGDTGTPKGPLPTEAPVSVKPGSPNTEREQNLKTQSPELNSPPGVTEQVAADLK